MGETMATSISASRWWAHPPSDGDNTDFGMVHLQAFCSTTCREPGSCLWAGPSSAFAQGAKPDGQLGGPAAEPSA